MTKENILPQNDEWTERQLLASEVIQEVIGVKNETDIVFNVWETNVTDVWSITKEEQLLLPEWYELLLTWYNEKLRKWNNVDCHLEEKLLKKHSLDWDYISRPHNHLNDYVWSNVEGSINRWLWKVDNTSWSESRCSRKELELLNSLDAVKEWLREEATYAERLVHYENKKKKQKGYKVRVMDVYEEKFDYDLLIMFINDTRWYLYDLLENINKIKDSNKIDTELESLKQLFHIIKWITWQMHIKLMYEMNSKADYVVSELLENSSISKEKYLDILEQIVRLNIKMLEFFKNHYIDFNWFFEVKVEMLMKQLDEVLEWEDENLELELVLLWV